TLWCFRRSASNSTSSSRLSKRILAPFPTVLPPAQPVEEVAATGLLTQPQRT
ncbi:hypothetical protein M9458_051950, partial [Cirrhinus mrigala]